MGKFSRLSKTVDYSTFSITKEPGVLASGGMSPFAQIDVSGHPLVGEYRIESALDDTGSQANTYIAINHGQQYVLKLYRKGFSPAEEVHKVLSSGECPYIAPLISSGRYRGDYWYEVYPYYSFGTLEQMISAQGRCSDRFIEKKLLPALDGALHYLHSLGLVHADVKPDNIFISDDLESVVLGDFGVAGLKLRHDGLVPFRGTLEYAPNAIYSGNQIRIDEAYDYGALGLVLIKAYTGHSLFAGMTLEERDEAIVSLHVPESIPPKARSLIQGLLRNDGRVRFGHAECLRFAEEGKPPGTYALRRGRGRFASAELDSRQKSFEFGFFENEMVIVASDAALLDACEKYWTGACASIDARKLRDFLRQITGDDEFYARFVTPFQHRPIDERVFRFCSALRLKVCGAQDHTVAYKGVIAPSILHFLKEAGSDRDKDLLDILDGGAIPDYLEMHGYDDGLVHSVEEILALEQPLSVKADMIVAICDSDSHTLYLRGSLVESVDDLLRLMGQLSIAEINELAENPSLKPWLHKHRCDFVINELEAFDE